MVVIVLLDTKCDYTLTTEYRKKHFLSGLLLQEVRSALNEIGEVRKVAIRTLRNQLAKHAFDDRYQKEVGVCPMRLYYLFSFI